MAKNIAIFGCSGAIGQAFALYYKGQDIQNVIYGFSRNQPDATNHFNHIIKLDGYNEASLEKASLDLKNRNILFDLVIVANGILHDGQSLQPEKSMRDLSAEKFQFIFAVNTITPALIAKYFIPLLAKDRRSVFAALSARVGSISDNALGGWYAYRASKAALNMVLKNMSIETARRHKDMIIIGLHPGTVDSDLSKPFQSHVKEGHLFTADFAAEKLAHVIDSVNPDQSGKCFAWDGEEINP